MKRSLPNLSPISCKQKGKATPLSGTSSVKRFALKQGTRVREKERERERERFSQYHLNGMALLSLLPPSFFPPSLSSFARNAAGETRKFHSPPEFIAANMDFEFRGRLKRRGGRRRKGERAERCSQTKTGRSY